MINLHSLEFRYTSGPFRLELPTFTLDQAEKVAVIGPSGVGKTTLLNLIAGILVPTKGAVEVNKVKVDQLSDSERRAFRIKNIGFVFQDFELIDYLKVIDNIVHPFRISASLKLDRGARDRAAQLAQQMGIDDKLKRYPDELSQGEKQRVAICRALLPQPKVVLADEATGNLDPDNKFKILDLLFESIEQNSATLLAVTHDHELLNRFDRTIDFQDFVQSQPS